MKINFGQFKGQDLNELEDWYLKSLIKYRDPDDPENGAENRKNRQKMDQKLIFYNNNLIKECKKILQTRGQIEERMAQKPVNTSTKESPLQSLAESYVTEVLLKDIQQEIEKIYAIADATSKKIQEFSLSSKKREIPTTPY